MVDRALKWNVPHPQPECDDECFGCKLQSVQLGGAPTVQTRMEKQWAKDLPAYARLRKEGKQPKSVQNAYELETRATTQREIEMGRIINPNAWKQVGHMIEDAEEVARKAVVMPNTEDAKKLGQAMREHAKTP